MTSDPASRKGCGVLCFMCGIGRNRFTQLKKGGIVMSVYKIVEIIGTSPTSWEDAAQKALATASKSLEELRIAEVVKQDVTIDKGKITSYRVRLNLSFKFRESA